MRRRLLWSTAATVAVLVLTAGSCGDDGADAVLGEVGRGDVVEVEPRRPCCDRATTLTAVADGTLAEVRRPGDEVEGDILAVVDSPRASAGWRRREALAALTRPAAPPGVRVAVRPGARS